MPSKKVAKKSQIEIRKTGQRVDDVVKNLLKCGKDENENVNVQVFRSIRKIGEVQAGLVLTTSMHFIESANPKPGAKQNILRTLSEIIQEVAGDREEETFDPDLALIVVNFCLRQMINAGKETKIAAASSNCLVVMAVQHCEIVIDCTLKHFPPGKVPNPFILKTLGSVADMNPTRSVIKLNDILAKMIPCLGAVKKAPMRQKFVNTFKNLCEAVIHSRSEMEEEEAGTIPYEEFKRQFAICFDIVFGQWRKEKDSKLRTTVLACGGLMCEVMDGKKFLSSWKPMIDTITTSYKKEKSPEHYQISLGLSHCLKASIDNNVYPGLDKEMLEETVDALLKTILPLTCQPKDYTNHLATKNYTQLLRSFEYLAIGSLQQVIQFILDHFQDKSVTMRIGSLSILRHLVNSLDDDLIGSRSLILASCVTLMKESNVEVRKCLVQLIMSMADKGYLNVEGGQQMVLMLVKQASLKDEPIVAVKKGGKKKAPAVSSVDLRQAAEHILNIFATKLPITHDVMWPLLFECIIPEKYTSGVGTIARVLSYIAREKGKNEDDSYYVDWVADPNLPKPMEMVVRLFVLLNEPFASPRCGEFICSLLHSIAELVHPAIVETLQDNLPHLASFLKNKDRATVEQKWFSMVLRLFKEMLSCVAGDDELLIVIGGALVNQFKTYRKVSLRKTTLVYLGQVIMFSNYKNWISEKLSWLTTELNINNLEELEGTAQGLGIAASTHLDTVLTKLTSMIKPAQPVKKSSGFFSVFSSKKKDTIPANVKSLVLRSWGWICGYADGKTLTSYMDAHITTNLKKLLDEKQPAMVIESIIICINRLGRSLKKGAPEFVLKAREKYIRTMLDFVRSGSLKVKTAAMECLSTLIYLKPPLALDSPLRSEIIDKTLKLLNKKPNMAEKKKKSKKKKGEDAPESPEKIDDDHELYEHLRSVLIALLESVPTVDSLHQLLFQLEFWIVSNLDTERKLALSMYLAVIKRFMNLLRGGSDHEDEFLKKLGPSLATIIPRITDSVGAIRNTSSEVIQMLLYVDQLLSDREGDPSPSEDLKTLTSLKQGIVREPVAENRINLVGQVAQVFACLISPNEFKSLVIGVIPGVNDCDEQSSFGTCRVLCELFRERGNEVSGYLEKIVEKYLHEMIKLSDGSRRLKYYLQIIVILSREHFDQLLDILLNKPLPLSREVILSLQAIGLEENLAPQLLDKLIFLLNNTPIHEQEVTHIVAASTTAFKAIISLETLKQLIPEKNPQIFCTCITRVGTATKAVAKVDNDGDQNKKNKKQKKKKDPSKKTTKKGKKLDTISKGDVQSDAVDCLHEYFKAAGCLNVLHDADSSDLWNKLKKKHYEEGLMELSNIYCQYHADTLEVLFKEADPFLRKHYTGQRLTISCLLSEWVKFCGSDFNLLQALVDTLLPRVTDAAPRVRKQALIGLGNLKDVWQPELAPYAMSILTQSSGAMEDHQQEVSAAAIGCLSKILTVLDVQTVQPSLITICFCTRKFLNSPNDQMREEAYRLFASLCRFGIEGNKINFEEQLHQNVTGIIVHTADKEDKVAEAAFDCFTTVAKYLENEGLMECAENSSFGSSNYDRFLHHLTPVLNADFDERITLYVRSAVEYFKDTRNHIKGNAALLAAKLVSDVVTTEEHQIDINVCVDELFGLQKSKSPLVRQQAALALSHLSKV